MSRINTLKQLEALYGKPGETSLIKEVKQVIPHYRTFIEASPFCTLATVAPEGMDCTPRGDHPGFVRVHDERTLMMPDRHGNNRTDSLANIVRDKRVALCFMVPGSTNCLRVNGTAYISVDEDLLSSFAVEGKAPRSVIIMKTEAVYFQCGRAILRSRLWDNDARDNADSLPKPGEVLAWLSDNKIGGEDYDNTWEERARETLW